MLLMIPLLAFIQKLIYIAKRLVDIFVHLEEHTPIIRSLKPSTNHDNYSAITLPIL